VHDVASPIVNTQAEVDGQLEDGRQTGSNPFHLSRDPLAAILPLFPRCLQFPIPLGLNLVLSS
jgi:hypothetical protein